MVQLDADAEEVEDITHVTEEDSLSIEKKEKELIIRAGWEKNSYWMKYLVLGYLP